MSRGLLSYHELHNSLFRIRKRFVEAPRLVARDSDLLAGDAYLIAAHAAIEYFFEDLCRRAIYSSLWTYRRTGKQPSVIAGIVDAHYHVCVGALPRNELAAHPSEQEQVKAAVLWHGKRIDNNQGIKRSNLLAIILPLGFRESDFDPVWLASMDSFGRLRGDTAHGRPALRFGKPAIDIAPGQSSPVEVAVWTHAATRTRTTQAPWDIDTTLDALLPEMRAWDGRIRSRL